VRVLAAEAHRALPRRVFVPSVLVYYYFSSTCVSGLSLGAAFTPCAVRHLGAPRDACCTHL